MLNSPAEQAPIQRSRVLKWALGICTTFYTILFPFLFYMALLSAMISDSPRITPFMVGITMFMMFWLPLSIPVSIYLMWSKYNRCQPNKALFVSGLPFYVFVVIMIIFRLFDLLIHR